MFSKFLGISVIPPVYVPDISKLLGKLVCGIIETVVKKKSAKNIESTQIPEPATAAKPDATHHNDNNAFQTRPSSEDR